MNLIEVDIENNVLSFTGQIIDLLLELGVKASKIDTVEKRIIGLIRSSDRTNMNKLWFYDRLRTIIKNECGVELIKKDEIKNGSLEKLAEKFAGSGII